MRDIAPSFPQREAPKAFVDSVLSQANERYEQRYELKLQGYDVGRSATSVSEIYGMEKYKVFKGIPVTEGKINLFKIGRILDYIAVPKDWS